MFQDVVKKLENVINKKVQNLYKEYKIPSVFLENPRKRSYGDYAMNIAMQLSKILSKSPIELANDIKIEIEKIEEILNVEIAGPGFINITLKPVFYLHNLNEIYKNKLHEKIFWKL